MMLTRLVPLLPSLWYQWETAGQRLHQAPEWRVGHHHHLSPVLSDEGIQDVRGSLPRSTEPWLSWMWKRKDTGADLRSHLSIEEVMVEHVVVAELLLTVELGVPETQRSFLMTLLLLQQMVVQRLSVRPLSECGSFGFHHDWPCVEVPLATQSFPLLLLGTGWPLHAME